MLGIFFTVIGFFVVGLGLGLDGFDDPTVGKELRMRFVAMGILMLLLGLVIAVFTL